MSKNPLTPAIRFSGFTDAWERRQLGECFAERVESMPSGELISVTINDGIKKFSELGRRDSSNDDKTKYKKVCVGDIAYNSMRMWQGASGYSPYEGIVSPAYTVLSPNAGIDAKCFSYLFKRPNIIHTFKINSQGITSDNWNLKYPTLSEISVNISKELEEQQKIASQLSTLDRLIIHQQKKYEKLVNLKKAMLDKMFPQTGELVPEVRFAGFSGNWERWKLAHYLETSYDKNSAGVYSKQDVLSVSGDLGVVNQIEFHGRSFAGVSVMNYGIVQTGDIVYTKSPLRAQPFGIIKTNKGPAGIVSTLYAVYHPKAIVAPDFVQLYFEHDGRLNNYLQPLVNKGAKNDMKISAENALQGLVCFPSLAEQRRIVHSFTALDIVISLHKQRLEILRNLKKAFLEKMFV